MLDLIKEYIAEDETLTEEERQAIDTTISLMQKNAKFYDLMQAKMDSFFASRVLSMLLGLKKDDTLTWPFGVFNIRNRIFKESIPYKVRGLQVKEIDTERAELRVRMDNDNRDIYVEYPKNIKSEDLKSEDLVFKWRGKNKPELAYCYKNFYKSSN